MRMNIDDGVAQSLARTAWTILLLTGLHAHAGASPLWSEPIVGTPQATLVAARTCKQVSSCEEAVRLWCGGYRRADADGDGIPCENVCSTREEVDRIRAAIGC